MPLSRPAAVVVFAAVLLAGCSLSPPSDSAERRARARARLVAVAGEFPASPAGGEAGRRLMESLRSLGTGEESRPLRRRLARSGVAQWAREDAAALARILADHEGALEAVRQAALAEPEGLGILLPEPGREFPDLKPVLGAAGLLAADGRIALASGKLDRAASDAHALMRLLRACYAEPSLVAQLFGRAAERGALTFVRDAVGVGDPGTLAAFADGLSRLEKMPAHAWLAGEARRVERSYELREGGAQPRKPAADRAWTDAYLAAIFERYADLASAASYDDLRRWQSRMAARAEEHEKAFSRPWLKLVLSPATRRESTVEWVADLLVVYETDSAAEAFAARASRRLTLLALAVASRGSEQGVLPAEIDAEGSAFRNDYTEERPLYERRADGSARLALPQAIESSRHDNGPGALPLGFEWLIPAPHPHERRARS